MGFYSQSKVYEGAITRLQWGPTSLPFEFTGPRDETLAARHSAWLGIALNTTPIYVVTGADAETLLNRTCTNRDFRLMPVGGSKHALICNVKGQMLADGVIMKTDEGTFRTYWEAPVLQYYVDKAAAEGLDVRGEYVADEFFLQLDGPKSLSILEEASGTDFHDLAFAHNKHADFRGHQVIVHRLGMSGALAYEIHGRMDDFEDVYGRLREVLLANDGRLQGFRNYCTVNHTPAGYPNQNIHFLYPTLSSDPGLAEFMSHMGANQLNNGSASDNIDNAFSSPYDVGWGYLVNFDHDFMGKEALQAIAQHQPYKMVTLEWNSNDVAEVFRSQFNGTGKAMYEPIEYFSGFDDMSQMMAVRTDYVLDADGNHIGVATGKTYAYHEQRMISLAKIKPEVAVEGTEVKVLWGSPNYPQKEIRATVAPFPYYQGEWRNETCDVDKLVPKKLV